MVLESMRRALAPLQIYHSRTGNINNELKTYADELERLYTELDEMLTEGFIATATGEGLAVYEKMFGPERSSLTPQQRRYRLHLRMSLGGGDFTPAGFYRALESLGLAYTISEFPALNRVNIIAQTDYSAADQAFIANEVAKIMPAHTGFQMVFNTMTWEQLDARDKTFAQLDSDNLTWKEINALA